MRLLIVGTLKGQLTTASKLAMDNGTSVTHAQTMDQALVVLRSGRGADLLMVDVALDIRDLVLRLDAERIAVPIVACGISKDARAAVAAIQAGAKEYIPAARSGADRRRCRRRHQRSRASWSIAINDGAAVESHPQIAPSDASVLITGMIRHRQGGGCALRSQPVNQLRAPSSRSTRKRSRGACLNSGRCSAMRKALSAAVMRAASASSGGSHRRTLLLDEISGWMTRLISEAVARDPGAVISLGQEPKPVPVDISSASDVKPQPSRWQRGFARTAVPASVVVNLKIPPLRQRPADARAGAALHHKKYSRRRRRDRPLCSRRGTAHARAQPLAGNVQELETPFTAQCSFTAGDEIGIDGILMPGGTRLDQARNLPAIAHAALAAETVTRALVGRTVADVERDLHSGDAQALPRQPHHAANISASIRTLRNKLNEYSRRRRPGAAGGRRGAARGVGVSEQPWFSD
jgi:CheY-like chemotaxis protein